MALVAMLRDSFVVQKKLLRDEDVTEAVTLASVLPGPLAVMVVAYIGNKLRGLSGALVAIVGVLLPSFILVFGLSILYFQYHEEIPFPAILKGVLPVVAGIIISVGITMARAGCKQLVHYLAFMLSIIFMILFPSKITIVILLLSAFVFGGLINREAQHRSEKIKWPGFNYSIYWVALVLIVLYILLLIFLPANIYTQLVSIFSSVSLTLFGGGYVVIPLLQSILVDELRWVTSEEFIYGISIGQITPGPILISSVFFGYKVAGVGGALLSTLGIFGPPVILILMLARVYDAIRNNVFIIGAMQFLKPIVAGVILFSGFDMVIRAGSDVNIYFVLTLCIGSVILNFWLKFKPVLLVILGGVLGFLIF
jgi:chromate transporter